MERYLTVEQAAQVLQVHPDTVRGWLRDSQLAGRKVGRAWRISESELRDKLHPASSTNPQQQEDDRQTS